MKIWKNGHRCGISVLPVTEKIGVDLTPGKGGRITELNKEAQQFINESFPGVSFTTFMVVGTPSGQWPLSVWIELFFI